MSSWSIRLLALVLAMLPALPALAERCATDDAGETLCLAKPAQRIVTLSPGATELAFAAGAGEQVVAVVAYDDSPAEVAALPSVGSHSRLDLEALLSLEPDLVIGWISGNPAEQLETLESLSIPVFRLEPGDLSGVASAVERLARLAGSEAVGEGRARRFREGVAALAERHAEAEPITVFYQVWDAPLMTLNDTHWISEMIRLCGGVNVFGDLPRLVPRLDEEAVLAAAPDVIITGGMGEEDRAWLDDWRRYPELPAVARGNLFLVPPSLIQRPSLRLLEGAERLCERLEHARAQR
ncbi:cobalamin-binding protein [Halomonas urumqiensis]|uniref:Cobalamin-binding protein n=1 Tax=Halomonas urumqiensis TaxID=1684789 RepID=A0A2N7UKP8_9GAMM|nr:cobalamin-binding protein [Halomonas urumqiensis]PMR81021.1 cobalamin-binding protein [Halomonas urumqiensis]PTB01122.1 cobalamin-binding protein [Halomonas urumqiensis]GHE22852.1 cobalamin-binding protein [Halomonas urumqiensis]